MAINNQAIGRYARYMSGKTAEEIANEDNVTLTTVEKSLAKGAELENQRVVAQVMQLRDQGALRNEQFRQSVRQNYEAQAFELIDFLMKGENVEVSVNPETGEKIFKYFRDPKIADMALGHYQRIASMVEKPMPSTVINNVQQNNTANIGEGSFDFETSIQRIKERQKAAAPADDVIDTESKLITDGSDDDESLNF